MKARFETFAAISVAAHLGLFAGVIGARAHRAAEPGGAGAATRATGATAAIAGETFEVPDLQEAPEEADESPGIELDEPGRGGNASAAGIASGEASGSAAPAGGKRGKVGAKGGAHRGAAAPPPDPPPLYGAVGDRAAGDLLDTFLRTFPLAESSDPIWERTPLGFYASGDVTFYLDPDGSLTHASVSPNGAPAFREAIARTTALLRHRLFTSHGATTRLHMIVRVTDQLMNHGAFTIDARGSFDLPSGRHVSVSTAVR